MCACLGDNQILVLGFLRRCMLELLISHSRWLPDECIPVTLLKKKRFIGGKINKRGMSCYLPLPSSRLIFFDVLKNALRMKMKKNDITATGTRKIGFTTAATTTAPTMLRITCVASRIALGKNSSIALQIQD